MGICTYVIGIKPQDNRYDCMKNIFDLCKILNISVPREVTDYFGDYQPDPKGLIVDNIQSACKEWTHPDKAEQGIEVTIDLLPKDVKIIRFINS